MDIVTIDIGRFWAKVDRTAHGDCWIWRAAVGKSHGYGIFKVGTRTERAHRVSFALDRVCDPGLLRVLHTCDIKLCVNPGHLLGGTHLDNMRHLAERGPATQPIIVGYAADKARVGENNGQSKLTETKVARIRRMKGAATQRVIAAKFGVSHILVGKIHRREIWRG